jgi:hypothetical protein
VKVPPTSIENSHSSKDIDGTQTVERLDAMLLA